MYAYSLCLHYKCFVGYFYYVKMYTNAITLFNDSTLGECYCKMRKAINKLLADKYKWSALLTDVIYWVHVPIKKKEHQVCHRIIK